MGNRTLLLRWNGVHGEEDGPVLVFLFCVGEWKHLVERLRLVHKPVRVGGPGCSLSVSDVLDVVGLV